MFLNVFTEQLLMTSAGNLIQLIRLVVYFYISVTHCALISI